MSLTRIIYRLLHGHSFPSSLSYSDQAGYTTSEEGCLQLNSIPDSHSTSLHRAPSTQTSLNIL